MQDTNSILEKLSNINSEEKWHDALEEFLPTTNETINDLKKSNLEIYNAFCNFDASKSQKKSSFLLRFICERILRSANSWKKVSNQIIPNLDVVDQILYFSQKEKRRCDNLFSNYYTAIYHHITGNDETSLIYFESAKNELLQNKDILKSDEHGVFQIKPFDISIFNKGLQKKNMSFEPKWLDYAAETDRASGSCVAVFFDDVYFQAFSENFLNSTISSTKSSIYIHFHITNISETSLKIIDTLTKRIEKTPIKLSFSVDDHNVTDRAYFTCTRFLALPFLFERFSEVLIVDADSEIKKDIGLLFKELNGSDAAVLFSKGPWGYKPWRRCWAGGCYFNRNDRTNYLIELYKEILSYWWVDSGQRNWWIDQNSLYYSLSTAKNFVPGLMVHDLDGSILKYIYSSEELKVKLLTKQSKISDLTSSGLSWNEALRKIQL